MRYLICVAIILTVVGCKDNHKGSGPIQINPEWGEPMEPEPDEYIAPIICDVPQCGTNVLGLTAGATSEHELRRVPIEQVKAKVRAAFSARAPEAALIRELALGVNDAMPPLSLAAQAWLVTALDTAAPGWRVPRDVQVSDSRIPRYFG